MSPTRREQLLRRKSQIDAQLKALDARERKQQRQEDTRRKILAGAVVLEKAAADPAFSASLMALLDGSLTRPQDRLLFGLQEPVSAPNPNEGREGTGGS